jgi:hypothetical protein
MELQCCVCSRSPDNRLAFYCQTCARTGLYDLRVRHALALVEREAVARKVENFTSRRDPQPKRPEIPSQDAKDQRWTFEAAQVDINLATEKISAAKLSSKKLRSEVTSKRNRVAELHRQLDQKRSELGAAKHGILPRREATLYEVEQNIQKNRHRLNVSHNTTVRARIVLCREAASLYGLKHKQRRVNNEIKEEYHIAGLPIIDIRELNGMLNSSNQADALDAPYTEINASLTNICYLVALVSHYLSLRLPAEITLPHDSHPLPTICTPASSYSTPTSKNETRSGAVSPSASKHIDRRTLSRPRPLSLEKPLPVLAKEDPSAFKLFLEGVTLLAYDVAWMCRTQGLLANTSSWEDVCPLGRNLYELLGPSNLSKPPPLPRTNSDPATPPRRSDTGNMMGQFSHGTAHSFLASAEGLEFMKGWKIGSSVSVVAKVRSVLEAELAGAEWEVLEEREWSEEPRPEDQVVDIKRRPRKNNRPDSEQAKPKAESPQIDRRRTSVEPSPLSRDSSDRGRGSEREDEARKGERGYVKLRPRT